MLPRFMRCFKQISGLLASHMIKGRMALRVSEILNSVLLFLLFPKGEVLLEQLDD